MGETFEGALFGDDAARLGRRIVGASIEADVAEVRTALGELWTDAVIDGWLRSSNVHLDGARPIDLLTLGEVDAVLDAVRIERAGGYR